MMKGVYIKVKQLVAQLEDERVPLVNYFLGFLFIMFLRNFAECFSEPYNNLNSTTDLNSNLLHYSLSYTVLALMLIILLNFAVKTPIMKITRVMLPGFIIIWLCPILDLIISGGKGAVLLYLEPGDNNGNLLYAYLTFFQGIRGVSPGIRIEILVGLFGIFTYLRVKQLNVIYSLIYTILAYSLIFLWGSSPYFIYATMGLLGFNYDVSIQMMVNFYLLLLFLLGLIVAWRANPRLTKVIVKDLRFLRVLYYALMLLFGAALALSLSPYDLWPQLYFSPDIIINIILSLISLLFAALFSIVINNLADLEIDKISNQNRPLIKKVISPQHYASLGYISLAIAIFYALMINARAVLLIMVFAGTYYLYSIPPFRFKRLPVISKLAISINSLALTLLGFTLVQKGIYGFPVLLYAIYLIGFTLSANFIDLKDVAGDKSAGIRTLPGLIGEKPAKILIGLSFWVTSVMFYVFLQNLYYLPLLFVAGGIMFWLVNKKNYDERWLLIFFNASIFALMVYLLFKVK